MAEIVVSAVVGEAVSRLSSLVSSDRSNRESAEIKAERLEMAVLKIHSALAISEQWHTSYTPLLHWKGKLKRVAKEGDEILHAHKRKVLQSKEGSSSTTTATFKQRIIQATKRFIAFSCKDEDLIDTTVQRFERLADGTDSFIKFVQSGGHPKKSMFLPSLTPGSLLAGNSMEFSLRRGNIDALILICPILNPQVDNGLEACFLLSYENDVAWEKNLKMLFWFHLSEATDILGTAMSCLDLLAPQFSAACAATKGLVAQMTEQGTEYSYPLVMSRWWCHQMQSGHCVPFEPSKWNGHTDVRSPLPDPVIHVGAICYVSPLIGKSSLPTNDGRPLELACQISRRLGPEKLCNQYEQVEPHVVEEILPSVTNGRQALQNSRQLRCPQNLTLLSVTPVLSQPLTLSNDYLMENSGTLANSSRSSQQENIVRASQEHTIWNEFMLNLLQR